MRVFFVILLLILTFNACSQHEAKVSNRTKPSWINNPNQDGLNGSVGLADIHYKGVSYQRKLAISRALDELALQKGVLVSLNMQKKERIKNEQLSSDMKVQSSYETQNAKLTAHIQDAWQDTTSKRLYIWLVLD